MILFLPKALWGHESPLFLPLEKIKKISLSLSHFSSLETKTGPREEEEGEPFEEASGSSPDPPSTASLRIAAGERREPEEEEEEAEEPRESTDLAPAAALFFPTSLSQIPSATIQLRAQTEIIGLTPEAVGKSDASATKRFWTSHVSPVAPSTAPVVGELPARAVPI